MSIPKIPATGDNLVVDKVQLIVESGARPTHSARYQSQELGQTMRNNVLLMNPRLLDEVYVFSSSSHPSTATSQIWASSFLGQKSLPDGFITIRKDLLDVSNAADEETYKVNKKLKDLLHTTDQLPVGFSWSNNILKPNEARTRLVQLMSFHRRVMRHNYGLLSTSTNEFIGIQPRWCCGEDPHLFCERWEKLFAEFCDDEKVVGSRNISELYNALKFDTIHNRQFLEWVFLPPMNMLMDDCKVAARSGEDADTNPATEELQHHRETAKNSRSNESQSKNIESSEFSKTDKHFPIRLSETHNLHHSMQNPPQEQYFQPGNNESKVNTNPRLQPLQELYQLAKILFGSIGPQRYGITDNEKGSMTLNPFWARLEENY